jgi:hypothetical protein
VRIEARILGHDGKALPDEDITFASPGQIATAFYYDSTSPNSAEKTCEPATSEFDPDAVSFEAGDSGTHSAGGGVDLNPSCSIALDDN